MATTPATSPEQGKRIQVGKAQAMMLGFVIGSSVVTVFSLMVAKTYFSQANYLNKISNGKEKAVNQLKSNKEAVSALVTAYQSFASESPNLIGGNSDGNGSRDGDNGRLVLDALPSKYDFPALATSLEKMLTGYQINSITGTDDATVQEKVVDVKTVEMPFSMSLTTDYSGLQKLMGTLEKSIRPFQLNKLSLTGSNNSLQVDINAKTFFQPEKTITINSEAVK